MPATPRSINPDIDPVLEAIILKAMEKDPAQRFANAQEMRQALNDYLAGRPVPGLGVHNDRTQVLGAGIPPMDGTAVMPKPIGTNTMGAGATTNFRSGKPQQPPQNDNKKKIVIGVIVVAIIAVIVGIAAFSLGGNGERATVPDVTNMALGEAKTTLEEAGFKIGAETEVFSSTVDSGRIVSTNPPGGQEAVKGSRIDLSISKGTEQVSVPDLKGQTSEEAMRTLSSYGLYGQEGESTFSENVKEGCVASQDQPAGSSLNKGDTVVFHLSKGAENVSVPNVVGATVSNAENSLKNAGFKVNTSYRYSSNTPEGRVISQDPSGTAPKGSTVTIAISNGPEEAQVPNVVGESEADATSTLKNAGFEVSVKHMASGTVEKGLVISQDVLGKANKGSRVTIVVSTGSA